jgi:hypothetical protein
MPAWDRVMEPKAGIAMPGKAPERMRAPQRLPFAEATKQVQAPLTATTIKRA